MPAGKCCVLLCEEAKGRRYNKNLYVHLSKAAKHAEWILNCMCVVLHMQKKCVILKGIMHCLVRSSCLYQSPAWLHREK